MLPKGLVVLTAQKDHGFLHFVHTSETIPFPLGGGGQVISPRRGNPAGLNLEATPLLRGQSRKL